MRAAIFALALVAALALVDASSENTLSSCKTDYRQAIESQPESTERCGALARLRDCFVSGSSQMTQRELYLARGFLESLSFLEQCADIDVSALAAPEPEVVPTISETAASRERRAVTVSILSLSTSVSSVEASLSNFCADTDISSSIGSLESAVTSLSAAVASNVQANIDAFGSSATSFLTSSLNDADSYTQNAFANAINTVHGVEATISSLNTMIRASISSNVVALKGEVTTNTSISQSNILAQTASIQAVLQNNATAMRATISTETDAIRSGQSATLSVLTSSTTYLDAVNSTILSAGASLGTLYSGLAESNYLNPQNPVYRWGAWSTYSQAFGNWYAGNTAGLFGGVAPSTWGDGNGVASQLSSSKEVLRGLFNKRGFAGWSATLHAEEWYYTSSTNSRHFGALFRIRNTLTTTVTWSVAWYYSMYSGWSEAASVTVNGASTWSDTGSSCGSCTATLNLAIPANRVSTVIFIASSGGPTGTRSLYSGFYNDCLKLPTGLQYVDDMDTINGDWST